MIANILRDIFSIIHCSSTVYNTKKLLQCKSFMPLNQFNSIQLNKQLGRSSKQKVDRPRLADLTIFILCWSKDQLPHKLINTE